MNEQKLRLLVDEYGRRLTNFCLYLTRSREDAEDLYQETWLKVYRFFRQYDDAQPFDKWLFTVCANTFKNQLKKKKRTQETIYEESLLTAQLAGPGHPDDAGQDEVRDAVLRLSPKLRTVTVLFYYNDYSVAHIADILNIPKGTVQSRLHKARQQLKEDLAYEQQ